MGLLIWSLLALVLAGLVVFSSQLEFLVPAVAAFLALLVALIPGLGDNYFVQTAVWIAASVAGFALFRRQLKALKMPKEGPVEDSVRGKTAVVTEALEDGVPGRVSFQGTTWSALAAEAVAVGAEVEVLEQDGLLLHVQQRREDRIAEEFKALEAKSLEAKSKEGNP